jgi:hypothetical protein
LPKKYQGIGQIGGALLGTAAGLGVGKPLAKKLEKKAASLNSVSLNALGLSSLTALPGAVAGAVAAGPESRGRGAALGGLGGLVGGVGAGHLAARYTPGGAARVLPAAALGSLGVGALGGYLARKKEKTAEKLEPKPPHQALTAAKTVVGGGLGMLAGYGGMKAIDAGLQKVRGRGLPKGNAAMWAVPLVAGAGGLAYSHLQQRTLDKMRADHLKRQEMKRGSQDS